MNQRSRLKYSMLITALLSIAIMLTGCRDAQSDAITLTITEQVVRHSVPLHAPITIQQTIDIGDVIILEDFGHHEFTITVNELQNAFVLLYIESFWGYDQVELAYGEELELRSATMSTWVEWTLVFEK